MSGFDPRVPDFWDPQKLDAEVRRQFDLCRDCRMCVGYCPSFPSMFDAMDEGERTAAQLSKAEIDRVIDLCFQCKLCFVKCPYTPPHARDMDVPGLMLRYKAVQTRARGGMTSQDKALADPDKLGRIGTAMPGMTNRVNSNRLARAAMENTLGIHRQRKLPVYRAPSFLKWFDRRGKKDAKKRVALFATCSVNYNEPDIGAAAVQVLERSGVAVEVVYEGCCGMPNLDGGDLEGAAAKLRANLERLFPLVEQGVPILVPQATCGYVLKVELPKLVPGEAAERVAKNTFDLCEWLWKLHQGGGLDTKFSRPQGRIAYHAPCHLRAQNVGTRAKDLLALIPETEVELVERCSAFDGTWGMKKQFYELSKKYARKLVGALEGNDKVASDCVLAGLNVEEATGRAPRHPIQILRDAYGLAPEWESR